MAISDKLRFAGLASTEGWKRFSKFIRRWSAFGSMAPKAVPDRLLIAPQDLRTPDPNTALEIYSGRFFLAGQMVELNGDSPFNEVDTGEFWQSELHKFHWLRHLEAAQTNLSQNNAQALITDWISIHSKPNNSVAWNEEITALRLISWLSHSVPIVEEADGNFYRNWLKSISTHIRFLKTNSVDAPDGMPRLTCKIALAFSALCISDQTTFLRNAAKNLDEELERQVLEDGGHISRNAAHLPQLLAMLLPLRESYAKLELQPSQTLIASIDKMMSALKFHRLGDGNLARFNGVSITPNDLVATILRYDDTKGHAANEAFASGYQRLESGGTIIIADAGKHASNSLTQSASAGTLSFEFTDNQIPIVINCGLPFLPNRQIEYACRTTAAHSTAGLNHESSSIIYRDDKFNLSGRVVSGPTNVSCEREATENSSSLKMSHNGYFPRFGTIHHRFLGQSKGGDKILGEDKFAGEGGKQIKGKLPVEFTIRFHLHPSLSAGKTENGKSILVLGGKGIAWKFTCVDVVPQLEESTFFASLSGPRRTKQIVLTGDARTISSVRWVFEKQLTRKPGKKTKSENMLPL